jgi:hypothetical protein
MKLLHITFRFEFADAIQRILERHDIDRFVRWPMIEGEDRDGRAYGTKVYPGSVTVVNAQVPDDRVDAVLDDLQDFRAEREAHHHLEALVLPVERRLSDHLE